MKRQISNVNLGDGRVRSRVRIEGEECAESSLEYRFYQRQMLQFMFENTGMLDCGLNIFQKLSMYHNGICWVVEAEAVAQDANDNSNQNGHP